jgi:hypothetical protein
MSTLKNLITWKDADQNLCTLAAYIIHQSMVELRSSEFTLIEYPIEDGSKVPLNFGSYGVRTVFSHGENMLYEPDTGVLFPPETFGDVMSAQCWWCFQNLIKMKLKQARAELKKNLYGEGEKAKTSKQSSRNASARKRQSKFGRREERE